MPGRPPLVALALLSAGALAFEILLSRLFSIIQWHHFAAMLISLAMLGYGVSGMLLTLLRERLLASYPRVFVGCAAAFGVLAVGAFLLAQRLPFNALEIYWDARQPLYLFALYLLLALPFVFAASAIGLTFARYGMAAHRVYSYDLCGAAMGCLLIVLLLFQLPPQDALRAVGCLGLAAAALAAWQFRLRRRLLLPLFALAALLLAVGLPPGWTQLQLSPYKRLSQALQVPGAQVLQQRSSPLGLLTVVDSPRVPFRHAPGLSLNAAQEPPPQLGVFIDGDGFSALTRFDGDLAPVAYLGQTTSALPYQLLERPQVLVLGAGAGGGVLQALLHAPRRVDAVELDARMVELVRSRYAAFGGDLYRRPEVAVQVAEARNFVEASTERYDLIQLELMGDFGASASGLYGMSESSLYTVEGLQACLRRLAPGGLLAITRWVTLPPRDLLKLAATVVAAQRQVGVADPAQSLALIRGWQTGTLLVKNGAYTAREIAAIRAFAEAHSFDVEALPGLARAESNRYNVLDEPYFFDGMAALTQGQGEDFIARYKFDIRPPSDDRPYFFHFFRWQSLPEILRLQARGSLSLLELGYPILLATLAQALLASMLLILLPLWLGLRRQGVAAAGKGATFGYFACVGFAFIFIEIVFIQKYALLLGHPLYAMAGGLGAMLLCAGLGSRSAPWLLARLPARGRAGLLMGAIALLVLLNLLAASWLLPFAAGLPLWLRAALVLALIAPPAFLMGMPFPLGMARLGAAAPALVPWAWGVNACATVVGALLAALLSMHLGYAGVAWLALTLYLAAAMLLPRLPQGAAA